MEVQFIDRILTCSDCHGEFIFTAGEQLFFHDKQFKNDPKRCKPCKSRRSGLAAAANGAGPAAAGLSRTETRTECSECGVQTTVPFKPTQGRPVLCRQCFQAKSRATPAPAPTVPVPVNAPVTVPSPAHMPAAAMAAANPPPAQPPTEAQTLSALTEASLNSNGETLSPEAARLALTSMTSASAASCVASAADLASISELNQAPASASAIPAQLLTAAKVEATPAELAAETTDA
jgi:CxxC-x17-CxxC domain-containing protein